METETNLNHASKNTKAKPTRIAMYVIYDKDGILDGYRKYYLQELKKVTDYILAVVCGTITPESRDELEQLVDEIYVRENQGLLAGAWVDGIAHIGWDTLDNYDEFFMLNDSFFGPFYPLDDMMDAMEKSDADFYGCMRNFEQKNYTSIAGRALKHGHFMGSICYFYIIKERLLHSNEFKSYWSSTPEIEGDWDTYFFAEIDFFQYVKDAGFRIDAYQGEKLKNYCFDNLTLNIKKLVCDEKIPFARIKPFCSDLRDYCISSNYGRDAREALDYIDKHTDYDVNLIWDYILRTKNLTDIWNELQLEYVVPKNCVEKKYDYSGRIAAIVHIYYEDQVEVVADYCKNFTDKTDFYVTTTSKKTEKEIIKAFNDRKLNYKCKVRPNVGVAMSTLWVTYADVVLSGDYEYICYFHDKKSPYADYSMHGEQFGYRCYQNLFGTNEIVKNIINLFEEHKRLGIIGVPFVYNGMYFGAKSLSWGVNYQTTVDLAERLDLSVDINRYLAPPAPYGDMFWFRSEALKKIIGYGLTYDDFDIEYVPDGTILHAIERIYGLAAQDSGFYYADVINTDEARSDLMNYQYFLFGIVDAFHTIGQYPLTVAQAKGVLSDLCSQASGTAKKSGKRLAFKNKIKARTPKPIWNIMKKIYHKFGGKKYVG